MDSSSSAITITDQDESLLRITAEFVSESGETTGTPLDIPVTLTVDKLRVLCNSLLSQDDSTTYAFFIDDREITSTIQETLSTTSPGDGPIFTEKVVQILYQPQAQFRVRAVTRCTSSMPGHSEPVLCSNFSPNGQYLASGSGDSTVRFWDVDTETPMFTCSGHKNWILVISWSPAGNKLASGCKSGKICIWDPSTGKQVGKPLAGHKEWITALAWEPLHINGESRQLASSSKDHDVRIWDVILGQTVRIFTGHTSSITCLRWSGTGLVYSGSQDRTIKVWRSLDGVLCRTLTGHAHWVNSIALSTDYVMRTGAFEPAEASLAYGQEEIDAATLQKKALARYELVCNSKPGHEEFMVSGSDDFSMMLWCPARDSKPIVQMTGHQQAVNDVKFSPDGRIIASASFDKSIKLWDGKSGKFLGTLRGHVKAVYQIAWSADSRLLVSASADSTINLWSMRTKKLELNLPGHADQVYTIDWSPNGLRVVSGGKDRILKIWRQ